MKIVILDGYTENPGDLSWEELGKLGELTVYDRTAAADIVSRIGDAEIVITNKTPISRETMDLCPNIRYIAVLATGYNIVDIAAAKEKGIPVSNVPTYGTAAVGQFAIAMLLEICHHVATTATPSTRASGTPAPTSATGTIPSSSWTARPWASSALAASARPPARSPGPWA